MIGQMTELSPRGTEDKRGSTCLYCSCEDEGDDKSNIKEKITKDHGKEKKQRANRRHPVKKIGKMTGHQKQKWNKTWRRNV